MRTESREPVLLVFSMAPMLARRQHGGGNCLPRMQRGEEQGRVLHKSEGRKEVEGCGGDKRQMDWIEEREKQTGEWGIDRRIYNH